jgi:drug/metabolite transporter (DMT)-like permease
MLAASFIFASMNIFVKMLSHLPVFELVFARSVVSLIISYVNVRRMDVSPLGKKENRKILWLRGLFGTIGLSCFFWTLQRMPLATAVVIHYVAPLFTTLIAAVWLKEKTTWLQVLFFTLSILGIIVIEGFDARVQMFDTFIGVVGALAAAGAYNCIRILKTREKANVIIMYFPLVTLPLSALFLTLSSAWVLPSGNEWFLLLLIGVLTQMAQYYLTRSYQTEKASVVSSITYIGILYSLIYGWFIFDESFNVKVILGILLVLAGVLLNVFYKKKPVSTGSS